MEYKDIDFLIRPGKTISKTVLYREATCLAWPSEYQPPVSRPELRPVIPYPGYACAPHWIYASYEWGIASDGSQSKGFFRPVRKGARETAGAGSFELWEVQLLLP